MIMQCFQSLLLVYLPIYLYQYQLSMDNNPLSINSDNGDKKSLQGNQSTIDTSSLIQNQLSTEEVRDIPAVAATGTAHSHHHTQHQHNCTHQHHNLSKQEHILHKMKTQTGQSTHQQCTHHNHNHNHNHNHKHSQSCKFYNPAQFQSQQLSTITQIDLTVDSSIPGAILNYLNGDLHRTWTILDKLQKANLVDKKLEGVFILKELGLNKGVAPLKCLTANNGNIAQTLSDLKPKQEEAQIEYIQELPEEYTVLIDGLSLAASDEEIKKMILSNIIDVRQMGIIRMYMLIEIAKGVFFIPKEYISPQVLVRISAIVNGLKNKSQQPFKMKLNPVEGGPDQGITKLLEQTKPEDLHKVIIVSNSKSLIDKCITHYKDVRIMHGQRFLEEAMKSQSKEYIQEILALK